jgi:hypothetical protein
MLEKPQKQRAILIGSAVIAGISSMPGLSIINCCCCAGILFGGALAVYLYQKDFQPDMPPLETSDGLIVGLLSGIFGAIGATVISALILLSLGPVEAEFLMNIVGSVIEDLAENGTIPYDMADQFLEGMDEQMSDAMSFVGILTSFFFNIIIFPIFGMLGGLIGYGLFRNKTVPQAQS